MALNKEAQKKLLKQLKFADAQIATLVDNDDEVDVDVPGTLKIYDEAGLTELETNIKKGYIKEADAQEIWCRKMNTEHDLGLTGSAAKDQKKVQEAMKAKFIKEAGITPTEWKTKFEDLQATVDTKNIELTSWQERYNTLESEKKYRKLFFPEMSDALDDEEWIARLQKNFEIKKDGDIEGLWDRAKNKFVVDEKANVLPYSEAWATIRTEDRFKGWHKAKVAEPATPDPKKTHDPRNPRNPVLKTRKYSSDTEILKEVDKQFPLEKKGKVAGWAKGRQELFNRLRAETA